MKRVRRVLLVVLLICITGLGFSAPTIAFSQKEQARTASLECLGLPVGLQPSYEGFSAGALSAGVHPELLYAVTGQDVRTGDSPWRYDDFVWRPELVIDCTGGTLDLRQRLMAIAPFVPKNLTVYVESGQGEAICKQVAAWLDDGLLPDYLGYECVWTDCMLVFTPTYRQSLVCAAWIADPSVQTADTDIAALAREAKRLARRASYGSERYQAHILHDLVAEQTEYYADKTHTGQNASEALLSSRAVCAGYADAYRLLALLSGLDCQYVIGTVEQHGKTIPHGWNKVMVDGDWYNVDVTWDDPAGESGQIDTRYFLVGDDTLAENHTWERKAWSESASDYAARQENT